MTQRMDRIRRGAL